jgi:hypothetical protein
VIPAWSSCHGLLLARHPHRELLPHHAAQHLLPTQLWGLKCDVDS